MTKKKLEHFIYLIGHKPHFHLEKGKIYKGIQENQARIEKKRSDSSYKNVHSSQKEQD